MFSSSRAREEIILRQCLSRPTRSKKSSSWEVVFRDPSGSIFREAVMGWTGSLSTENQRSVLLPSLERAVEYAKSLGLDYKIEGPPPHKNESEVEPKVYLSIPRP